MASAVTVAFKTRHPRAGIPDFGDGGAFPEIRTPQYPLGMGRIKTAATSSAVPLQVDEDGAVRYDALARVGRDTDARVHSQYRDLVPMDVPHDAADRWVRPSEDQNTLVTAKTREAIDKIVATRMGALRTTGAVAAAAARSEPTRFVRYTPALPGGGAGTSRVIRLTSVPADPIEPSRFGFRRIPPAPGSPPAPVMHSPPRKLTKADRDEWNIPPCISNWKNAKGYTIPLDKRLAADGRGLQEHSINDNFAKFSEALMIAERHAREEVRQRAAMQQRIALKEKALKEETLRQLAAEAREERRGIITRTILACTGGNTPSGTASRPRGSGGPSSSSYAHPGALRHRNNEEDEEGAIREDDEEKEQDDDRSQDRHRDRHRNRCEGDDDRDDDARRKRDELRHEKTRQLQREYRMSHMGVDAKSRYVKTMADRDISEKIALGAIKPTVSKETMFDARLFNQTEGLNSGFTNEDSYNIYDKPLFAEPSKVYKGLQKADENALPQRTGPVEFERGNAYQSSNSNPPAHLPHASSSSSASARHTSMPSSSSSSSAGSKRQQK